MCMPDKGKDTSNKKQASFSNEVTMNGKTYRECSQHVIYYATKSSLSILQSLMDRGDNVGLVGNNMRVVETHPDLKFDTRSIDNHQVSAIPLVTA